MNAQTRQTENDTCQDVFNDMSAILKGVFPPQRVMSARVSESNLAIDMLEKETSFEIRANLPGVNKEDINVTLERGVLTIKASLNPIDVDQSQVAILRNERRHGNFSRSVQLGKEIDESSIKANYNDGVLILTLAKSEQVLPKKINISH